MIFVFSWCLFCVFVGVSLNFEIKMKVLINSISYNIVGPVPNVSEKY